MGSKKYKDRGKDKKSGEGKKKDKCCEKHLKKGKHCKNCPLRGECELPE